jgi:hypothetical protein
MAECLRHQAEWSRDDPRPRFRRGITTVEARAFDSIPIGDGHPRGSIQSLVSEVPPRPFVGRGLAHGTPNTNLGIIGSTFGFCYGKRIHRADDELSRVAYH